MGKFDDLTDGDAAFVGRPSDPEGTNDPLVGYAINSWRRAENHLVYAENHKQIKDKVLEHLSAEQKAVFDGIVQNLAHVRGEGMLAEKLAEQGEPPEDVFGTIVEVNLVQAATAKRSIAIGLLHGMIVTVDEGINSEKNDLEHNALHTALAAMDEYVTTIASMDWTEQRVHANAKHTKLDDFSAKMAEAMGRGLRELADGADTEPGTGHSHTRSKLLGGRREGDGAPPDAQRNILEDLLESIGMAGPTAGPSDGNASIPPREYPDPKAPPDADDDPLGMNENDGTAWADQQDKPDA